MSKLFSVLILLALMTLPAAQAQQLTPIGRPDHRAVVARLNAALPPSVWGDYVGVTPKGRWCALTVASNGWEYFVTAKQAIPGGFWFANKPGLTTVAASFALTSSVNPVVVTGFKETAQSISVAYEPVIPPNVNFQYIYSGSIVVYKNQYGRPSRVELTEKIYDRWNDYLSVRPISCGEPAGEE